MFQKKDYVYADSIGVCRVDEITNLAQKNGNTYQYYGLRSAMNNKKTAYFPVENHEVTIRELISLEEAERILALSDEEKKNLSLEELYEAKFVKKNEVEKQKRQEEKKKK